MKVALAEVKVASIAVKEEALVEVKAALVAVKVELGEEKAGLGVVDVEEVGELGEEAEVEWVVEGLENGNLTDIAVAKERKYPVLEIASIYKYCTRPRKNPCFWWL